MLIVELTLQSPIFGETLRQHPETELSVDSQNLLDDGTIQMLVWTQTTEPDAFEAALVDDWTISDYHCLTTEARRRLYRVRFTEEATEFSVHHRWVELGGTLLDAVGTHDGWELRMRFPDRDAVSAFYETCEETGVDVTIRALYQTLDGDGQAFGLTEKQREAVRLAFDEGYFDVPRRTNLTELAATVGVSRQAFSRRLTRGLHGLVEGTVGDATET